MALKFANCQACNETHVLRADGRMSIHDTAVGTRCENAPVAAPTRVRLPRPQRENRDAPRRRNDPDLDDKELQAAFEVALDRDQNPAEPAALNQSNGVKQRQSKSERKKRERARREANTAQLLAQFEVTPYDRWRVKYINSLTHKNAQAAAARSREITEAQAQARRKAEATRRAKFNEKPAKKKEFDPKKARITIVRGGLPTLGKKH